MELEKRLDDLKTLIQNPEFLAGKGLCGDVNICFFCYDPKDEMVVRAFVQRLEEKKGSLQCRPKIFNLFQIFLEICHEKKIIDQIASLEDQKGTKFLLEQMRNIANCATFVQKMQYGPQERGDVVIITGIGEAFPFIRIHSLLEAMQPFFPKVPIVALYPGTFDGRNVRLFDRLTPNAYYRAFNPL